MLALAIKKLIKYRRFKTSKALAESIHIKETTLSSWKYEKKDIPIQFLDYCKKERVSLDYLFDITPTASPFDQPSDWTAPHDPSDETICKARSILTGPDETRAHALKSIIDDMARAAAEEKPHAKKKHKPLRKAKC